MHTVSILTHLPSLSSASSQRKSQIDEPRLTSLTASPRTPRTPWRGGATSYTRLILGHTQASHIPLDLN